MKQDLTQLAVIILWNGFTGCDAMNDYFAIEADTMVYIVCEVDLIKY